MTAEWMKDQDELENTMAESETSVENPKVEETPMTEAENQLAKIANAEKNCCIKESAVEAAKEMLKAAKSSYDDAVAKLRHLAEGAVNDQDRPLLNRQDDQPETEVDGWESQPISVLWESDPIKGFGKSKQELLVDEVSTLGGFEELRKSVGNDADHLSKLMPKGIGESLADELENRHLDFVAKFSDKPDDAGLIQFENQLLERIGELETDSDWMKKTENQEFFDAGETAFSDNQPMTVCPHDFETTELDDWLRGYCSAKAVADLEAAEEDDYEPEPQGDYEDVPDDEGGLQPAASLNDL